jgi:hypothetical protein
MVMTRFRLKFAAVGAVLLSGGAIGLSTFHAHASTAVPSDNRTLAVAHWLGVGSVPASPWTVISDIAGSRYRSHVPGVGLVEVDAHTLEVTEVIFDGQLVGSATHRVEQASAVTAARSYAATHFTGFSALSQRRTTYVDHGTFQEYRVTWQAHHGDAWLPTTVTLGVNSDTGRIAYFSSRRVALTLGGTTAQVTSAAAKAAAIAVVHTAGVVASEPSLDVLLTNGAQRLVWITEVRGTPTSGVHMPLYDVVWTDAHTGSTTIVAKG